MEVIAVKLWKVGNQQWRQGVLLIFVISFIPILLFGSLNTLANKDLENNELNHRRKTSD